MCRLSSNSTVQNLQIVHTAVCLALLIGIVLRMKKLRRRKCMVIQQHESRVKWHWYQFITISPWMVRAWKSQCEESNPLPSWVQWWIINGRGHWLGLVFYVLFSAFILIVMWQEGRPACKKTHSTNSLLVAWHSSRTSVFGLRIFHVLCETCSWWVTTYVGKPSATVQQTRPTQPFISLGSIDE